ncbi:MAG: hypothetical protein Q8O00_11860, partial [Holophaga sp.]|nr:hypothetical protein [Holophaga sp.]
LCQVEAPELEDKALVTVLASGFEFPAESIYTPSYQAAPVMAAPTPRVNTGHVYGEMPVNSEQPVPATPTRLLPQGPTPSGEVMGMGDDLHVPAIIRMTQGRLGIE